MMKKNMRKLRNLKIERKLQKSLSRGFTLIEILVVIGIIAVLASVVLVAINPSRQFKLARDSQRVSNVNAVLNSISQNIAEHKGVFYCDQTPTALPTTESAAVIKSESGGIDLAPCLVPTYVSLMPFDPNAIGAHYTSITDYDTGYNVSQDNLGRVTISAVGEITPLITVTR